MAELQTLARPYARAAFDVALQAGALPAWDAALERLGTAAADEQVAPVLGHPAVGDEVLVALFAEFSGEKPQGLDNFLAVLAENKRLVLLPAIATQFSALRAAQEKMSQVTVTSASEVAQAQKDAIVTALTTRLGTDVQVGWEVDPELIGGAIVTAGDLIIDGSVQGELDRLSANLIQ